MPAALSSTKSTNKLVDRAPADSAPSADLGEDGDRAAKGSAGRPGRIRNGLKAVYDREAWRRSAACRQVDSDLFFPLGRTGVWADQIERAKEICATCPVRSQCLEFALTTNQDYGVWGGLDEDERRVLRRQWREAAQRKAAQRKAVQG